MSKLVWDKTGERFFETGVKQGVLYLQSEDGTYPKGVVWNGLTSVSENPSGAEANAFYADDIKYLNITSAEDFAATIGCYTYPDEFAECDGSKEIADGVSIGQQEHKAFGFCYRTGLGNDTKGNDYGYKIHLVYGAKAAPTGKDYGTVNESPEPIELSYEISTTPVAVDGFKPTAHLVINSTKISAEKLAELEDILYGSDEEEPRMPLPNEIAQLVGKAA